MGAVVSTLQSAASTVYDWAVKCFEASVQFLKSIWESFVGYMNKLMDFMKEQFSKMRLYFRYSNQTTRVSRSVSQDGQTQHAQVQQTNLQVGVGYNQDEEEPATKIQGDYPDLISEQKRVLKNLKKIQKVVDKSVEVMEAAVADSDDPNEKVKTARNVQQLMNEDDMKSLFNEMNSAPSSLA